MSLERDTVKVSNSLPSNVFLSTYITKMKGQKVKGHRLNLIENVISATGGLIAMIIISILAVSLGYPMVLGPIGATCLLVFAIHEGPFSQPLPVIGGHFISTFAALLLWSLFGKSPVIIGITLAIAVFLMFILKVVHPPAAASAVVAINTQPGWDYLFMIVFCSILVIAISVIYNNLFKTRQYPKQWF
ncbi:HPP family protein [Niallia endozanthoxylica]|uniref:HPP family protein n=1 Tax=Niallia endozanthoxylica TaxID=2036016 RepID=A0A5J5I3F8_9BACI|nr:HPP family protein [Niallia endozanthoxylica]KAA9028426.1 HPP family protein [Niallia endozanthoxylica]